MSFPKRLKKRGEAGDLPPSTPSMPRRSREGGDVGAKHALPARIRRKWDLLMQTEGARLGLADCRPFLENKLANDIFYEGRFKGQPCIVKCSSRACESIRNEYTLGQKLHAQDPRHFPAFYAFHPGPLAFVAMEKIKGGKSLADEPDDRYADEVLAILDSLFQANVVHRDILPSNFLIAPDGRLKLIDLQFAIDMTAPRIDPWLERHPGYHFAVFAAGITRDGAWWDDATFARMLLPSLWDRARSRAGRLRYEIPFSRSIRIRLKCLALVMRMQRMFTPKGSRRRQTLDRRLERFK